MWCDSNLHGSFLQAGFRILNEVFPRSNMLEPGIGRLFKCFRKNFREKLDQFRLGADRVAKLDEYKSRLLNTKSVS